MHPQRRKASDAGAVIALALACLPAALPGAAAAQEQKAHLAAYCRSAYGPEYTPTVDRRDGGVLCSAPLERGPALIHQKVDIADVCAAQFGSTAARQFGKDIFCAESATPPQTIDLAQHCRQLFGPDTTLERRLTDNAPLCTVRGDGGLSLTHHEIDLAALCGSAGPGRAAGGTLTCGTAGGKVAAGGEPVRGGAGPTSGGGAARPGAAGGAGAGGAGGGAAHEGQTEADGAGEPDVDAAAAEPLPDDLNLSGIWVIKSVEGGSVQTAELGSIDTYVIRLKHDPKSGSVASDDADLPPGLAGKYTLWKADFKGRLTGSRIDGEYTRRFQEAFLCGGKAYVIREKLVMVVDPDTPRITAIMASQHSFRSGECAFGASRAAATYPRPTADAEHYRYWGFEPLEPGKGRIAKTDAKAGDRKGSDDQGDDDSAAAETEECRTCRWTLVHASDVPDLTGEIGEAMARAQAAAEAIRRSTIQQQREAFLRRSLEKAQLLVRP